MSEKEYVPRAADKDYRPRVPDSLSPLRRDPLHQPLQLGLRGKSRPGRDPDPAPWDLQPGTGGTWDLVLGDVTFIGVGVNQTIEVTGGTGLGIAAGKLIFLEIEADVPESIEVKLETTWTDFPTPYEYDYDPLTYTHTLLGYRFPLWQFVADPGGDPRFVQKGDVWGKKLCFSDLQLAFSIWEKRNATTGVVEIPPVAAPYFKQSTAAVIST